MNHPEVALIGPILSQEIQTSIPQVAVDGGIHYATNPILWVGDGDSHQVKINDLSMKMKPNQDETDLRFALDEIQSFNWKVLHLFGFLGKRKDHEWANLGEVCHELKNKGAGTHAIFYEGLKPSLTLYSAGDHEISLQGRFSLLSFEKAKVSILGECQYQMNDENLDFLSGRGVSNQANGLIHIQCASPFMVINGDSNR